MSAAHVSCPKCGEPLASSSLSGLCPRCLAFEILDAEPLASSDADAAPPAAGGVPMGDYEIFEELARGGMGVVYRARQVSLDREVAVKMILSGVLAGDEAVARFKVEAAAAAGLRHPHIVAIHEIGEEDGMHFFSMEYVAGKSLSALVRDGPLPARRAAELVEKIARAVAYAHERGVVHRDLKPSNVLVDAAGEPRVTDFGLAKKMGGSSDLTLSGQILGTPGYLAPEQARGQSHRAGPAVDIYGVGAILYHLLTGRPPFVGEDPMAVLRQVEQDDPPSLRLLNPGVPRELEAVTLKCLAREPERRYAGASEIAEEMRRWLDGRAVLAKPAGRIEKTARWLRRNPGPTGAATVIFLLLASIAIVSTIAARRLEKSRNAEASGRKELRRTLYTTGLRVAQQLREEGALGNVAEWVEAQSPPPGEEDLRTFEWRLVRAWTQGDQDSLMMLARPSDAGALSPCGRFATSWNGERTVLVDLRSGFDAGGWVDDARPLGVRRHLSVSADGRLAVATSMMGVRLWDNVSGEVRALATWPAEAAAFSLDGRWLAVSAFAESMDSLERGVVFFDTTTWREAGAFAGRACGFAWQGETLALLNLATGQLEWWKPGAAHPERIVALPDRPAMRLPAGFSADGRRVAVGRNGESLRVHDAATGAVIAEFAGAFSFHTVAVLSPDGRRLALGGLDQEIRVHDVEKPAAAPRVLRGHRARLYGLRFSDDGRQLVSWSGDGTLRTWTIDAANGRALIPTKMAGVPPVMPPDGRWVALADANDHCAIWDSALRAKIAECAVLPLAASADGRELLGLRDGKFIEWRDAATGAKTRELALPEMARAHLPRISPDARRAAIWTEPDRGAVFDLADGQRVMEMESGTTDAQFSPDQKWLALMTAGTGLRVLDVATWKERPPIVSPASRIAWSHDSWRVAFVWQENPPTLAVADVVSMKVEGTLTGQGTPNMQFAFAADGRTVVSSAQDGTLRFWNLPTWSRTLVLPAQGAVASLAFAPNDDALIVGHADGFARIEAPHTPPAVPDHGPAAEEAITKVLRALFAACRAKGRWPDSLKAVRVEVSADAVPWPSLRYAYENKPAILPPDPAIEWTEKRPPTERELTERLIAGEGRRVPVLRCFARFFQSGRVLNIDHDGDVYVSGADWREAAR